MTSTNTNNMMVIVDGDSTWAMDSRIIINWSEIIVPPKQESLPLKVDECAFQIKSEYLAWVHELGQQKIRNKSLISHLELSPNFSFWWMTRIAEKSVYNCPSIYQVFKLRTLENIYTERCCHGLVYCGNNKTLHIILKQWCKELGHSYKRYVSKKTDVHSDFSDVMKWGQKFPFCIQAVAYLFKKWFSRFRHLKTNKISQEIKTDQKDQAIIFTYFPNIDAEKTKEGRFWSRYWESLHDLLAQLPIKVNWIWLYNESKEISFQEAIKLQNVCNHKNSEKHRYFLLENFLTPKSFFKAVKTYFRLYFN